MVQRHIREWPDSGPTVARQHPTRPDTPTVRAQGHRSCGQTRPTPSTPPTRSTLRHSTLRHAQTRRTRLNCPTTLRHRSDTGQTLSTPSTPVSIDTAPTLLRHYSDTSDTSDTQTHQGSSFLASAGTPTMDLATYVAPETFAAFGDEWGGTSRFI